MLENRREVIRRGSDFIQTIDSLGWFPQDSIYLDQIKDIYRRQRRKLPTDPVARTRLEVRARLMDLRDVEGLKRLDQLEKESFGKQDDLGKEKAFVSGRLDKKKGNLLLSEVIWQAPTQILR